MGFLYLVWPFHGVSVFGMVLSWGFCIWYGPFMGFPYLVWPFHGVSVFGMVLSWGFCIWYGPFMGFLYLVWSFHGVSVFGMALQCGRKILLQRKNQQDKKLNLYNIVTCFVMTLWHKYLKKIVRKIENAGFQLFFFCNQIF